MTQEDESFALPVTRLGRFFVSHVFGVRKENAKRHLETTLGGMEKEYE